MTIKEIKKKLQEIEEQEKKKNTKQKKQTNKQKTTLKNIFAEIEKTEDGYIGYLKKGYITDNETFTIFAENKKDLIIQAEIEGVHKISIEEWEKY